MFSFIRFIINKRRIMNLARDYIYELEKGGTGYVSCMKDLMKKISSHIDEYKKDFSTYTKKNSDYVLAAKSMVTTDSFDLVSSGKYHIFGHLNMMNSPAKNLIYVHKRAVKEALDSGLISQEEYDEDLLSLKEAITQIF